MPRRRCCTKSIALVLVLAVRSVAAGRRSVEFVYEEDAVLAVGYESVEQPLTLYVS